MALAKLWTALFGKRDEGKQELPSDAISPVAKNATSARESESLKAPAAVAPPTVNAKGNVAETRAPRLATTEKGNGPAAERAVHRPATTESKGKAPKKADVAVTLPAIAVVPELPIKQFQRRNTDWTKRLGTAAVTSILDLCIADSTHMVELLESVVDSSSPAPKYVAVNQFEMGEQGLSLQQFHKRVRTLGGSPVAIPMTLSDGLKRLSQTLGTVDLILLNDVALWSDAEMSKLFRRVIRPTTLVFVRDAKGQWQSLATGLTATVGGDSASTKLSKTVARPSQSDRSRKAA